MHRATLRFWNNFANLPPHIQKIAKENFKLLKEDPRHPSLHFKKIGKFWSVRIGLFYRALAIEKDADHVWVWIGTHDDYDKMIKKTG